MCGLEFRRALPCAAGLLLLCAASAAAQANRATSAGPAETESATSAESALNAGPKVAVAHSRLGASADIDVDGDLSEAVWRSARWISDFRQKDPVIGAAPTQRTEVAFAYDDEALYIAGRMHDTEPHRILDLVTRRDQGGNTDIVLFSFDTYDDRRTAYTFAVTAAGSRSDWYHPRDREYDRDHTFDPIWEAATRLDSTGWTVEARIPFSQLRFNEGVDEWGLNINRYLPGRQEDLYWVVVPREEPGWSSQMGRLTGLAGVQPRRRLEISPYVAGDLALTSDALVNAADPFASGSEFTGRVGADLKYGLGPNLTLDATVNPDFGQVEADPAIVNLSAFETFFPERRPFFTEGANLLSGGSLPGYFYSRRIGTAPHGAAAGDYREVPDVTTILGAAKLTGRLGSGLSIGAIGALTAPETAKTYDAAGGGTFGKVRVEPTTGYGVVRLQQEVGASQSTFGLMGTAVTRHFSADDPTRGILATNAFTGGGDFNLRLDGGMYEVRGHAGLSYVEGSAEAIETVQRSSAHYFQRPDQDHVRLDPTRTSLLGGTAALRVEKTGGEHWLWNAGVWGDTPNLELNDIGRLNRADDLQSWAGLTYRETTPGELFRNYSVSVRSQSGWNFGGIRTGTNLNATLNGQFTSYWSANLRVTHDFEAMNDRLTRGGPRMGRASFQSLDARVSNPHTSRVRVTLGGFWGNLNHGDDYNVSLDVTFEPTDQLRVSLSPAYRRDTNRRQFYGFEDRSDERTFGTRYVFSTIEQSEISLPIRMNYAFHPDLSLELWAQPFAASGRFSEFGELPEAAAFDLRAYGTDGTTIDESTDPESGARLYTVTDGPDEFTLPDRNFNRLSFRSNLVMRWELRPGSTLFLVWQQNLSESAADGSYVRPGDLLDVFGAPGRNVLALKMSYWLQM
ncbi:MAG TPA: DUF5916 domain-containing protein [Gemmatimonadota bacterium]|nr:DUF5916 domain-containing protein [Gemmatimonadota bacterium]